MITKNTGFLSLILFIKKNYTGRAPKIDSISPQEIIDKLTYASPAQLSELITVVLNSNRYRSSRLGVRQSLKTNETVSRNILD